MYEHVAEYDVFGPNLLDLQKYKDRTYPEATIGRIDAMLDLWRDDATADLLAFGFDQAGDGQIVKVTLDGAEVAGSWAAIGSGAAIAEQQLSWRGMVMSESLQRVVYQVFEAKAHAERNAYVGGMTDALIMFANGAKGGVHLTDDTKTKLAEQISHYDRAPIEALSFFDHTPEENAKAGREQPDEWVRELTEKKVGGVIKIARNSGPEWRTRGPEGKQSQVGAAT